MRGCYTSINVLLLWGVHGVLRSAIYNILGFNNGTRLDNISRNFHFGAHCIGGPSG